MHEFKISIKYNTQHFILTGNILFARICFDGLLIRPMRFFVYRFAFSLVVHELLSAKKYIIVY